MRTALVYASMLLFVPAGLLASDHSPGAPFDIAPFGFRTADAKDSAYGIRWAEPRKIRRVVVEFDAGQAPADAANLRLQYWHRVWDGRADPLIVERGAGGVGWDAMDDWTNGRWITAKGEVKKTPSGCEFTFAPVSSDEIERASDQGVSYRKTLAIRVCNVGTFAPSRFRVYTDAVCRPLRVRIQFGRPQEPSFRTNGVESGHIEVFNGQVLGARAIGTTADVAADLAWTLKQSEAAGIEADLVMAADPIDGRYDRTVVTIRSSTRPFSFAADEIARGDRILVDDLGVLVTNDDDSISLEGYRDALQREFGGQTVYDRVSAEGEQTLSDAWNDMPLKHPLYFVHGLPGNRNTVRQHPNGEIEVTSVRRWFNVQRSPRDSDRKLWKGDWLRVSFGFPREELRGGRELEEGFLPVLRTWWQEGSLYYEQKTVLTAPRLGDIALDTPTVLLVQVRAVNTSESQEAVAALRLATDAGGNEKLVIKEDRVLAVLGAGEWLRFLIGGQGSLVQEGQAVKWTADLEPGQSMTLHVAIPSITLAGDEEIQAVRDLDFAAEAKRVCTYWRDLTGKGTQITTPEPWLNDFYKSHLRHLLVNGFKELDTDYLHAHVGTFHYGVYPNESIMMVSDLDRRGYHDQARRNYDAFLHYQGTVAMPGNFQSAEGQLYGAGGHETGGYNKSHGYVLWGMAQHWQFTREREWMDRAAPGMVKACEWVIRERRASMTARADGSQPLEYGWLPAGSLEDVTDYWNWLATNSATVWGFRALADALADFGHPEGKRLQTEAQAYYDDFMRGITESRILCPVVRLRDGTYVPKIPSRLYERGRAHGWLRETLEGSLFLPAYGLLAPDAPETRWVLKDYEDNLYISDRYGYAIPAYDAFWFSRGGFSMQANLLDGPLPYLWRDDVKHYLRAYFNGFASAFYPEIRMCNEHSLPELGYPRGDHFKTSDEAQSTYWLRLMFVNERGSDLYLGQAIPRYWLANGNKIGIERAASYFGPLSAQWESRTAEGVVQVTLDPPARNVPRTIYLRIRHPQDKPLVSVLLNGKPYDRIDREKEWIVLPGLLQGPQEIVARYE
ncbi:MAG TPA: hypothetical protein PKH24_11025 [Sedimentisphaerales bacterium]|jgi:hypothetical protein|nr:hypothetical protein [Sedimentisphaerales bacterium]HNU29822.1 hypothetical protein [Sedimentisphaerales bacterium]